MTKTEKEPWQRELFKVKLLKSLREPLSMRFDPKNAKCCKGTFIINQDCPLCLDFLEDYCMTCPFFMFHPLIVGETTRMSTMLKPCTNWIHMVMNEFGNFFEVVKITGIHRVIWAKNNDKRARELLNILRKRAEYLIKWVDEYEDPPKNAFSWLGGTDNEENY